MAGEKLNSLVDYERFIEAKIKSDPRINGSHWPQVWRGVGCLSMRLSRKGRVGVIQRSKIFSSCYKWVPSK